tara:strand:- start:2270 stop:2503 length:234 start_codon:yes stop_codon:yes gene_type:complete
MEDIQQYFTKQEEEISNTYMNVNGEGTTHTMPDGSVMPGATHTEGYGNIFTQKNYWIGVAVGVASLMLYQKVMKKNK